MFIEQIYTDCLAQAAYYIESEGEAAIIDPIRETKPYLDYAKERKSNIKFIFETHFHADFVSGHIDLADKTGAQIIFGPLANTKYDVHNAVDEEIFELGKIKIKAMHTPGHTPESTCYLLYDEEGNEHAIFTGDTLFVGDVGRPDLLDGTMTKEELAGMMYESLNNKIKVLPDEVIVYPAHGPGSSCGKSLGDEKSSTIGAQKSSNYALQEMSKDEFINIVTEGLLPPPQYFFTDAMINKNGSDNVEEVLESNVNALSLDEFKTALSNGATIIDSRFMDVFEKGFIPGSINIGLDGMYAIWVGTLINHDAQLLIVAENGMEEESIQRLSRVGYDNVLGYLENGINAWTEDNERLDSVDAFTPEQFARQLDENTTVLDVRKVVEYEEGHIENAINIPLAILEKSLDQLDKDKTYHVHCLTGYRSMSAIAILKANGFNKLVNISKGMEGLLETDIPMLTNELA
ncbi:MAG: MBL fold metallo-hydrolase [Bacteroidetes bacterium]|nr:MAG: MBL fold metallo-hydrolase [Bacteroidota bacterium]